MKHMADRGEGRRLAVLVLLSRQRSCDELTSLVPIKPSRTWQKATPRGPASSSLHTYNGVEFSSSLPRSEPLHAHVDDLLEPLKGNSAVRAFAETSRATEPETVPVRLWLYAETAVSELGLDLTADQIRAVAELGAAVGISVDWVTDGPE